MHPLHSRGMLQKVENRMGSIIKAVMFNNTNKLVARRMKEHQQPQIGSLELEAW